MNTIPKPYEVYRHFKGNFYQILAIAIHSETREQMVVYQQLYSPFKVYVRPLEMFMEPVDKKKYPNATQEDRFERQNQLRDAMNDGLYFEYQENKNESDKDTNPLSMTTESFDNQEKTVIDVSMNENETKVIEKTEEYCASDITEEEASLHPKLLKFLDADTYEEKLSILSDLHREINDEMINTMAVSLDLEVKEGDLEERYREVLNCLVTLEKFECNRLR